MDCQSHPLGQICIGKKSIATLLFTWATWRVLDYLQFSYFYSNSLSSALYRLLCLWVHLKIMRSSSYNC